jgi:hypothetical protein
MIGQQKKAKCVFYELYRYDMFHDAILENFFNLKSSKNSL